MANQNVIENLQWTKRLNQEKVDSVYLKHFGQKYTEYRRLWNTAGPGLLPEFPVNLDFELADACNLRCLHCFRNKEISEGMGLTINTGVSFTVEMFKKVMDEGSRYGLRAVNLGFSGECLLNPDLIEMVDIAYRSGVLDIRLITNGTLMTRETADRLLESHLTLLSISVDAGDTETYKRVKGRDGFDHLQGITKYIYQKRNGLRRDFPLIRASFYSSPESKGQQDMFLKKFQDNVDFIDFQKFHDMRKTRKHKIKTDCRAPFQRLAIFANGDVSPCCSFFSKKLVTGNINKMTVKEIWNSEATQKVREGLIEQKPVPVCVECLQCLTLAEGEDKK